MMGKKRVKKYKHKEMIIHYIQIDDFINFIKAILLICKTESS